jgi:DNA mismatch endonuclease, patch repair protein
VKLPGTPDIALVNPKVAVFVDGCFWHGCPHHGTMPKTNTAFWRAKIVRNRERDAEIDEKLRALGWKPIRVWEHDIKFSLGKVVGKLASLAQRRAALARQWRRKTK